jgi:peptidoglycan/xylan/chitin deacetylase (PgdA/CDA1 family)
MSSHSPDWDVFTAEWERRSSMRDDWDRVPSTASPHGTVLEPSLSLRLHQLGFRPTYPNGATFAVCLSHDVDVLITSQREMFGTLRRGQIPINGRNLAAVLHRGVDPRWDLEGILKLEATLGVPSSFYFLALERGDEDFNFSVREIGDQLRMVRGAGNEIGLHGGHAAYNNTDVMAREKQRLEGAMGGTVSGYRNHYLRFRTPETWQLLQQQGFAYDTTFGYSDSIGFRNGMCHPFRPIDPATGTFMDIVELPLVVMDISLFDHMKLAYDNALELWQQTVNKVKACNGMFTMLWHNTYPTVPLSVYGDLVQRLRDQGAWFTTGQGMVDHWNNSGQLARMEAIINEHIRPRT